MRQLTTFIMVVCAANALAGDQWMTSGRDIAYPQELFFVGIGISERSLEDAKQNAVVEARKQISVSINATMIDEQFSVIESGKEKSESRTESRSRLSTSGDVQGIEVVKTGMQGKNYYALAILDKKIFETNCRTRMVELRKELVTLIKGAETDINAVKTGPALIKLSRSKKIITRILDQRELLSAAAPVTDAEKLPYTQTDISLLYDKCVSALRMAKTRGDGQSFAVGIVPSDPFVVSVTADGNLASGIPVNLLDEANKVALTRYTDDVGTAAFSLGETADMSIGKHTYTAMIGLAVSPEFKKILTAQNQAFSYAVVSNPCYAKFIINAGANLSVGKDEIAKKVASRLSKYDIKEDPHSKATLAVSVSAYETGSVKGLSENSSFVRTEVTLAISLKDDDGREVGTLSAIGKGTGGSLIKSTANGIETATMEKDLKPLLDKLFMHCY